MQPKRRDCGIAEWLCTGLPRNRITDAEQDTKRARHIEMSGRGTWNWCISFAEDVPANFLGGASANGSDPKQVVLPEPSIGVEPV
jgi:hypothetical protein